MKISKTIERIIRKNTIVVFTLMMITVLASGGYQIYSDIQHNRSRPSSVETSEQALEDYMSRKNNQYQETATGLDRQFIEIEALKNKIGAIVNKETLTAEDSLKVIELHSQYVEMLENLEYEE